MSWIPDYDGFGPDRVGGLGDSIMTMVSDELAATYTSTPYEWAVACWPGLTTWQIRDAGWPQSLAATSPDHVIIISGTNDCNTVDAYWNGLVVLGVQGDVINSFSPNTQIHWVNVYSNPPQPPTGCSLQSHVNSFNDGLNYWASVKPNLHIVDWRSCVYYFSANGVTMLNSDGVHPTQDGQNLLRYIIDQSVA